VWGMVRVAKWVALVLGGNASDPAGLARDQNATTPLCYNPRCLIPFRVQMVGHRTAVRVGLPAQLSPPDEEALLAVCRSTYSRIMAMAPGNVSAAQLAMAEELRKAGFELRDDNEELIARLATIFAVLDDGRSVQRLGSGEWVVLREYG
jgi:hypothetical protein